MLTRFTAAARGRGRDVRTGGTSTSGITVRIRGLRYGLAIYGQVDKEGNDLFHIYRIGNDGETFEGKLTDKGFSTSQA